MTEKITDPEELPLEQESNERLEQVVKTKISFTQQELEAAYQQMIDHRQAEKAEATTVANELSQATGLSIRAKRIGAEEGYQSVGPHPDTHELYLMLSQYENWNRTIDLLAAHGVKMQPWSKKYDDSPTGEYIPPNHEKTYNVKIEYYDAHSSGF